MKFIDSPEHGVATINTNVLGDYINKLREVDSSVSIEVSRLLSLPGVLSNDADEETALRIKPILLGLVNEGCDKVIDMRRREGQSLEDDSEPVIN